MMLNWRVVSCTMNKGKSSNYVLRGDVNRVEYKEDGRGNVRFFSNPKSAERCAKKMNRRGVK